MTERGDWVLTVERLESGVFHGRLLGGAGDPPSVEVEFGAAPAMPLVPERDRAGHWRFAVAMPAGSLSDGTLVVRFRIAGEMAPRASYLVSAGSVAGGDLAARVAALEADVAMLRAAFLAFAADPPLRAAERSLLVAEVLERLSPEADEGAT